ncbi:SPOR domain-containing protein [Thiolinea disciformis]|uniref:SPOR domain-containing protein n=1 Tax=Thiolinea disciformis TaxID=125614 RepID=UPI00036CBA9F|nr:SPOR domain-containing protein [Thiolinea disciformis]
MDNKATTKRMIGAVVLVLIAALLLAWLLKGKNRSLEQRDLIAEQTKGAAPILGFPGVNQGTGTTLASNQGQLVPSDSANQEAPIGIDSGAAQKAGATTGTDAASTIASTDPNANLSNKDTAAKDFNVRDNGREVRPVVENGKPAAGVGSMGANEIASASNAKTGAKTPAAQLESAPIAATQPEPVNNTNANSTTQTLKLPPAAAPAETVAVAPPPAPDTNSSARAPSESVVPTPADTGSNNANRTAVANRDRPVANNQDELKPVPARTPNPRLVNERPVPPPVSQPRTVASAAPRPAPAPAVTTRPAAPTPAPAAASTGGGYVVQLLATSNKAKADDIRRAMSADGYPVFITQANVDGKPVYRVRVGSYPGKGDAAAIQGRMKSRYGQNQYVQNSFVTRN